MTSEHGGVNMSIEASATFMVMESETMQQMGEEREGLRLIFLDQLDIDMW